MGFSISKKIYDMARSMLDTYYANYWNNKWKKTTIIYNARSAGYIPIQDILNDGFNEKLDVGFEDYDDQMKYILWWTHNNIKYVQDSSKWELPEYWQIATETWNLKQGDCEDGAILMYKLARSHGIPAFRLKIVAGYVQHPNNNKQIVGHCYLLYLSERHNTWHVVDWCYYPLESYFSLYVEPHKLIDRYKDLWWSFNEQYCFSQKELELI